MSEADRPDPADVSALRNFYKPKGIGRGPGLLIAQAGRYKPEIPQALRDRMAAYDANPDPSARPHGEARRQKQAQGPFWTVPRTWQPPKGLRLWLINQLNRGCAVFVEIGHGFDVASMRGSSWGGPRTYDASVAVLSGLYKAFTALGLWCADASKRACGLRRVQ